ncbi:MAG TPA: prepilin-type N-terminal cleavage/methylation domain-containing protein [Candidatus Saccharimonadales bacterium]|nr:prepilin-type N-terminal cleavage/methylation domain-containing protein [Candidatus Saccharimonadales bacterium]
MRRFWGGYTVIEVMIVLAITGVLFGSAVMVFNGQQAKTSLSQNMYDFASKLQSYVTEVNSGVYDNSQTYGCSISGGKATLSTTSPGTNNDCLFVGRAIQLIPNSSDVYVYTIIGNRNLYNGGNDTGKTAQSLEDTNPQVASAAGTMVMVDKYSFPSDLSFDSAKATGQDGSSLTGYGDLIGLYEDLSGSGAGTNLETLAFPFPQGGDSNTPKSSSLADCLSLNAECASTTNGYSGSGYRRISNWEVCIKGSGSTKAEVKVKTSSAGISTEVNAQSCS